MSRALQALKIREIGEALEAAGLLTIQDKAVALGLSRSTTWAFLQADYKNSGLSATLVNTMLASPKIPEPVRGKLLEYVDEKISGRYGHNAMQLRRFVSRLAVAHHATEGHRAQAAIRNRLRTVHSADHVYVAIGPQQTTPPQLSGTGPSSGAFLVLPDEDWGGPGGGPKRRIFARKSCTTRCASQPLRMICGRMKMRSSVRSDVAKRARECRTQHRDHIEPRDSTAAPLLPLAHQAAEQNGLPARDRN